MKSAGSSWMTPIRRSTAADNRMFGADRGVGMAAVVRNKGWRLNEAWSDLKDMIRRERL